jgi:hypothetical protein
VERLQLALEELQRRDHRGLVGCQVRVDHGRVDVGGRDVAVAVEIEDGEGSDGRSGEVRGDDLVHHLGIRARAEQTAQARFRANPEQARDVVRWADRQLRRV